MIYRVTELLGDCKNFYCEANYMLAPVPLGSDIIGVTDCNQQFAVSTVNLA